MSQITGDVVRKLFAIEIAQQENISELEGEAFGNPMQNITEVHPETAGLGLSPEFPAPGLVHGEAPSQSKNKPSMQYSIGPDGNLIPAAESAQPAQSQPETTFTDLMGGFASKANLEYNRGASSSQSDVDRVGRNDVCPCGSGKKYKKCHGA